MGEDRDDGGDDRADTASAEFGRGDQRAPLNRGFIVELAIDLVDREGLSRLTMRRLGAACGVEAMALYRHVRGREDLLGGIVEHLVDTLHADQLAARRQEDGWQDFLVRLAHGVRQIAWDHPELFPLLATRAPEAPWVRPPLRSLRWMETFLDTLLSYGFSDEDAVLAYRSYTTFLLGQLLLEVSARGPVRARRRPATQNLSDYPHLRRLQPMLSQDQSATEFDDALEGVLDRLEQLFPQA